MSLVWSMSRLYHFVSDIAYMVRPRNGTLFGMLAGLLFDLNQYIHYSIPVGLVIAWFGFRFAEFCIDGLQAAWLYPIDGQPSSQPTLNVRRMNLRDKISERAIAKRTGLFQSLGNNRYGFPLRTDRSL